MTTPRLLSVSALILVFFTMLFAGVAVAEEQEGIGVWQCLQARSRSCPPDGLGRGAEDWWTYPVYKSKLGVVCEIQDAWLAEKCVGTRLVFAGIVNGKVTFRPTEDASFGAWLTCPAGYVRRYDQCVEIAAAASDEFCPLSHGLSSDPTTGRSVAFGVDLGSPGANRLELARFYSSQPLDLAAPAQSRLGNAWRTNFDAAASWKGSLSFTRFIHVAMPDWAEYNFALRTGKWVLVLPRMQNNALVWDVPATQPTLNLEILGSDVVLSAAGGRRYVFNNQGRLSKIIFPDGYSQSLIYQGAVNTRVVDSLGGWLAFTYGGTSDAGRQLPATLLTAARMSNGSLLRYTYEDRMSGGDPSSSGTSTSNSQWVLKSVLHPDETPSITADNPTTVYDYVPSSIRPYLLRSVVGPDGIRSAMWTYDRRGRSTAFEGAAGANSWRFSYDDANDSVAVSDLHGQSRVLSRRPGADGIRRLSPLNDTTPFARLKRGRSEGDGSCWLGIFCGKFPPLRPSAWDLLRSRPWKLVRKPPLEMMTTGGFSVIQVRSSSGMIEAVRSVARMKP